jgi:hypothetical protein
MMSTMRSYGRIGIRLWRITFGWPGVFITDPTALEGLKSKKA